MKYYKYITLTIFISIILVFISTSSFKTTKESIKPTPTAKVENVKGVTTKGVTLILDFGKNQTSTFTGIQVQNQSVFSVLKKITDEKKITLKIKEYSFGNLVEQIGDKINNNDLAWIYYVNGKSGEVAADKKRLTDGDIIEWKYIKPNF